MLFLKAERKDSQLLFAAKSFLKKNSLFWQIPLLYNEHTEPSPCSV